LDKLVTVDSLQSFLPFLIFLLTIIFYGSIIGAIAKRKHRNTWLWKASGAFGFLFSLVAIICFRDLNSLSAEDRKRSRLKEKIVLVTVIVMFVTGLSMYLQAE
jgi:hypothetical protein